MPQRSALPVGKVGSIDRFEWSILLILFAAISVFFRLYTASNVGGSDSTGYFMAALRLSQGYIFEAANILSKFGLVEDPPLTFSLGLLAFVYRSKMAQLMASRFLLVNVAT